MSENKVSIRWNYSWVSSMYSHIITTTSGTDRCKLHSDHYLAQHHYISALLSGSSVGVNEKEGKISN